MGTIGGGGRGTDLFERSLTPARGFRARIGGIRPRREDNALEEATARGVTAASRMGMQTGDPPSGEAAAVRHSTRTVRGARRTRNPCLQRGDSVGRNGSSVVEGGRITPRARAAAQGVG